jgi:hypothetical protein
MPRKREGPVETSKPARLRRQSGECRLSDLSDIVGIRRRAMSEN